MAPSVKILTERLKITKEQAEKIRGLINGTIKPESIPETAAWVKQCYNLPKTSELIMDAINNVLGTHGVEAIFESRLTWPDLEYCNTGDPYTDTIIHNCLKDSYYVGNWGSWAERHPNAS